MTEPEIFANPNWTETGIFAYRTLASKKINLVIYKWCSVIECISFESRSQPAKKQPNRKFGRLYLYKQ